MLSHRLNHEKHAPPHRIVRVACLRHKKVLTGELCQQSGSPEFTEYEELDHLGISPSDGPVQSALVFFKPN